MCGYWNHHAFKVLAKERDLQVSITLTFGVKVATGGGLITPREDYPTNLLGQGVSLMVVGESSIT
jgi:hypothetical protein